MSKCGVGGSVSGIGLGRVGLSFSGMSPPFTSPPLLIIVVWQIFASAVKGVKQTSPSLQCPVNKIILSATLGSVFTVRSVGCR